jgi:hypothetical protein
VRAATDSDVPSSRDDGLPRHADDVVDHNDHDDEYVVDASGDTSAGLRRR